MLDRKHVVSEPCQDILIGRGFWSDNWLDDDIFERSFMHDIEELAHALDHHSAIIRVLEDVRVSDQWIFRV